MRNIIVLLLLIVGSIKVGVSQNPVFYNFTTDQNLPSNDIYSLVQDYKGYIWLGTDAGLYKFNGVKYEYYPFVNQKSRSVTGLTLSKDSCLYFYNFTNQLCYIKNDKIYEIKHSYKKIGHIYTDEENNVWISHLLGTSKWIKKLNQWQEIKESITKAIVNNYKNNVTYILQDYGIDLIDKGKVQSFKSPLYSKLVYSGAIMQSDVLWIFDFISPMVLKFESGEFAVEKNASLITAIKNKKITNIKSLSDGNIWICTYSGLIKFNPKTGVVNSYYENIAFTDCIIDKESNYWFTTLNSGYYIAPNSSILVFNKQNDLLIPEKIKTLHSYKSTIYFSTTDGYVGRIHSEKEAPTIFRANVKGDINALFYDETNDKLYFNINHKLFALRNDRIQQVFNKSYPVKVFAKAYGTYFIGSSAGLQFETDLENQNENFIIKDWVNQIEYDSISQLLFVGTNNGVYKIGMKQNKPIVVSHFLENIQIRALDIDQAKDCAFIITIDGGVFKYCQNRITKIHKLDKNILVNHLTVYNNKLIISSNSGIVIVDLQSFQISEINKYNGLATNDIRETLVNNGFIWAASSKGLHKIPIEYKIAKENATIVLKNIVSASSRLDMRNHKVDLKYNEAIYIYTEVLHFSSLGKHQIAYRINESKWHFIPGDLSSIYIPNLPVGNSVIQIKAIDIFGKSSKNVIVFTAYVHPAYWQTWWFIVLVILVCIFVFYIILRSRVEGLRRRQQEELDKLNLQNELKISQETALKAQMKPHFVFNILNSIKAYIYENNKEEALKYLKLFSNLVRNVLEMSSKNKVTLDEEIRTLGIYISLEEMLMGGDFRYDLAIESGIYPSDIQIPSLIIQPIVENSFKHGLRHKQGSKRLRISIKKINEMTLEIGVEDNGIGRVASSKINMESEKMHQSFATDLTQKRIELLNMKSSGLVGIEYQDLFDDHNEPAGTRAILRINLYE